MSRSLERGVSLGIFDQVAYTSLVPHHDPKIVAYIASGILKNNAQVLMNEYTPFETTVSAKVLDEQIWSHDYFRDKARQYGCDYPPPVVMYLDFQKLEKAGKSLAKLIQFKKELAVYGTNLDAVVFITVLPFQSELSIAATTHHELAHYYSLRHYTIYNLPSPITRNKSGAKTVVNSITKGTFFEESYAYSEGEKYYHDRGSHIFPQDFRFQKRSLQFLTYNEKPLHYLSSFFWYGKWWFVRFIHAVVHPKEEFRDMYAQLAKQIPNFVERIEYARYTGKWHHLGAQIDMLYGRGFFKLLMDINFYQASQTVSDGIVAFRNQQITIEQLRTIVTSANQTSDK